MTDTPESVRKMADGHTWIRGMTGDDEAILAALRNYADLLERIKKAPKVVVTEKAYWMQSLESVTGETVALLLVEK